MQRLEYFNQCALKNRLNHPETTDEITTSLANLVRQSVKYVCLV